MTQTQTIVERRADTLRAHDENITDRLNRIEDMLLKTTEMLTRHVAADEQLKPALDELITLWRGSKLVLPVLASVVVAFVGVLTWAKDHIRW